MKLLTGLAGLVVGAGFMMLSTGCVQMTYTKTVTTTRNGAGQVTGTVEVETVTEPHSEIKHIEAVHDTTFDNWNNVK